MWNIRTGRLQFTLTGHTDSIEAVRWGGEGLLYTGGRDRLINVWAVEAGVPGVCGGGVMGVLSLSHSNIALLCCCYYYYYLCCVDFGSFIAVY